MQKKNIFGGNRKKRFGSLKRQLFKDRVKLVIILEMVSGVCLLST